MSESPGAVPPRVPHHQSDHERQLRQLDRLERHLKIIDERTHQMALDQATFDTELAALTTSVGTLISAVDAFIASQPAGVDLTAEGQAVTDASAAIAAELDKLNPATPSA